MKPRQIWFWTLLAAGLFFFIFVYQRFKPTPPSGNNRVLPELKAADVISVQVRPAGAGSLAIRAERTNHTWQLVEPLVYPARAAAIDGLLETLQSLNPATYITAAEIRNRPKADDEFGFTSAQSSIILQQAGYRAHLLVGGLTAPGDQVFLKVVAREGVYVVGAELLKQLPRSANDWRDRVVLHHDPARVDRIAVTNNTRAFILQRDTNSLWRMVWPLNAARADHARTEDALRQLSELRIRQFVTDEPQPDLEALGLLRPALELALSHSTNSPVLLQFGKPATTNEVYARRLGHNAIFTVDTDGLSAWRRAAVNDFRDLHLLTLTEAVADIDIQALLRFTVHRQTNDLWRILPDDIPADRDLVSELLFALTSIEIAQFTKDVVNPPELPEFGLASPVLKYSLLAAPNPQDSVPPTTNVLIVELDFGVATNAPDRIFVRRTDESSVYAITTNDFARLATEPWQLRERRLFTVTERDVAGLRVQQDGKTRELIRRGEYQWSFAPGSQGIINDLAVEETVRGLTRASARQWIARGAQGLERFGLDRPHRVILLLKSGGQLLIDFGSQASPEAQFASVQIAGEIYVMEFPWHLYRDVSTYLSIP